MIQRPVRIEGLYVKLEVCTSGELKLLLQGMAELCSVMIVVVVVVEKKVGYRARTPGLL